MNEYVIPQLNDDALEQYVLGIVLTYNEYYHQYSNILCQELFYNAKNERIFNIIKDIIDSGGAADIYTVSVWVMKHPGPDNPDAAYLMGCTDKATIASTFGQIVEALAEMRVRRDLRALGLNIVQASTDMSVSISELQETASKIQEQGKPQKLKDKSLQQANDDLRDMIVKARSGERPADIFMTGFKQIDETFAFSATELEIIAAETAMGKSILCSNIAVNMARNGTPCYYISLEMRSTHMAARINAPIADVSASKMIKHPESLTSEELREIEEAQKSTSQLPILFDEDVALSPESVVRAIRDKAKRNYKVFFIDYVQQLVQNVDDNSTEKLLGGFIRKLKNLAMELNICIFAVSQLSRDKINPRPQINRLRGSGQLEETANNILFIWRPTARGLSFSGVSFINPDERAEFIVGKARDASVSSFYMGFDGRLTTFYDLEKQPGNSSSNEKEKSKTRDYETKQIQTGIEDPNLPF